MVEDLNTDEYLVDTALNHLIRAGKLDNVGRVRVRHQRRTSSAQTRARGAGVDALDRGDARRADRAARDPRDRERARSATASTWRRCRSARTVRARRRREDPRGDRGGSSRDDDRGEPDEARGRWWRLLRGRRRRWRSRSAALPAGAQDDGGEKKVLRIGWAQDPQTLNPFVGPGRGGLHDLGDQLGPARQLQPGGPVARRPASPRAGRSPRTGRRSPSSWSRARSGRTASRSPPRTSSGRSRSSAATA